MGRALSAPICFFPPSTRSEFPPARFRSTAEVGGISSPGCRGAIDGPAWLGREQCSAPVPLEGTPRRRETSPHRFAPPKRFLRPPERPPQRHPTLFRPPRP